jgi:hypothetical protein
MAPLMQDAESLALYLGVLFYKVDAPCSCEALNLLPTAYIHYSISSKFITTILFQYCVTSLLGLEVKRTGRASVMKRSTSYIIHQLKSTIIYLIID